MQPHLWLNQRNHHHTAAASFHCSVISCKWALFTHRIRLTRQQQLLRFTWFAMIEQATCTWITFHRSTWIIKSFFSGPLWLIRPWRAAKKPTASFILRHVSHRETRRWQCMRAPVHHWEIWESTAEIHLTWAETVVNGLCQSCRHLELHLLPLAERVRLEILILDPMKPATAGERSRFRCG